MKRNLLNPSDDSDKPKALWLKGLQLGHKGLRLGQRRLIIIITFAAMIFSVALGYTIILLFAPPGFDVKFSIMMCLVMPLIMAPPLAWFLTRQFNALLHASRELFQMANYDALTDFLSRAAFMDHLDRLNDIAIRHQSVYAIAWLDIDHFKAINDGHGHAAGDQVLVAFAQKVRSLLRKSDFIGRLGGDEFVAVLPSTTETDAIYVAENIRSALNDMRVNVKSHQIQLTVSIGLAVQLPATPLSLEDLLSKADKALYKAKHAGRNCVMSNT